MLLLMLLLLLLLLLQVDANYAKIQKNLEIDGRAFFEMSETFDEERR